MKIVFCGNHIVGISILKLIVDLGYKPKQIITIDPQLAIDQGVSGFYDYSDDAEELNIPIKYLKKYNFSDEGDIFEFCEKNFDLLIQGGWQRLFPDKILQSLRLGAIGLHGSPDFLPRGRGRSPMNWSLINGDKRFILHMFMMKAGVDNGDVFDYFIYDINEFDDIETLYFKYSIAYEEMLKKNLPLLQKGEMKLIPQVGEASYYSKRTPEDGEINWEKLNVFQIHDFIRAQTRPYPGRFWPSWKQ